MTTVDDVEQAYQAIETAWETYRQTLRNALSNGVPQADIARRLDRTREMLRRDAMTAEDRAELYARQRRRTAGA